MPTSKPAISQRATRRSSRDFAARAPRGREARSPGAACYRGAVRAPHAALAAALGAALVACDEEPKLIDPFPILIDTSAGPVLLAAAANDGPPVEVAVDTLSPITVLDSFEPGAELQPPRQRRIALTLFGLASGRTPTVPRVRFPDTPAFDLHPCGSDELCRVGRPSDPVVVRGIVGADILSRSSVRFDFAAGELRFFPDAAGTAAARGDACEAVFGDPFRGGGTLVLGGDEIGFGGHRPVLRACLDAPAPPADQPRGTDAVLVISTGLGQSLLAASSYDRYAAATGAPPRTALPRGELFTTAGPVRGALGEIGRFALVGQAGDDSRQRGPCRELHANRVLSRNACEDPSAPIAVEDCPCPEDETFCRAGAAVEVERGIEVLVVSDDEPILQGLRAELRPEHAEVDGILGVDALRTVRLELDYPNDRVLAVCNGGGCSVHPAVRSRSNLDELAACRERAAAPDAGPVP